MNAKMENEISAVTDELAADPVRTRRVIRALVSQPWAIRPDMLDLMVEIADQHAAGIKRKYPEREPSQLEIRDGVAIVPIEGVLMNRATALQRISGATSPQQIIADYRSAMNDREIVAVVLDINSPGGQIAGVAEAANAIWNEKQNNPRPVYAVGEGTIASGAYWLAAQADKIFSTPTSLVGSIGIVSKISDYTRQEKNDGIDSVVLKTGSKKAIGIGTVTDEQIADVKSMADEYFSMFTGAVERGRAMTLSPDILSGRLYTASQAMANGLLDGIDDLDGVLKILKKIT